MSIAVWAEVEAVWKGTLAFPTNVWGGGINIINAILEVPKIILEKAAKF